MEDKKMFKFFKRRKKEKLEKEIQLVKEQEAIEVKKDHETEFREKMDRMKSLNKMKRDSFKYQTTINEYSVKAKRAFVKDDIKGDIARIYFYMSDRYNINLSKQQRKMMEVWNKLDPIDEWEKLKNKRVLKLQGNGNKYIN